MAELFGVFSATPLSSPQRERLELTMALLRGDGTLQLDVSAGEHWILGVGRHHDRDPAFAERRVRGRSEGRCLVGAVARTRRDGEAASSGTPPCGEGGALPLGSAAASCRDAPPRLVLQTDGLGLQPVYYVERDGAIAFCSRPTPLVAAGWVSDELDLDAILQFFTFEHLGGNRTFWSGVKLVPPATTLEFDAGGVKLDSTGATAVQPAPRRLGAKRAADDLYEQLETEILEQTRGSGRVAITLSGGLDSRALLGCALAGGIRPRTYTFGASQSSDVRRAREIAEASHVPHRFVPVEPAAFERWLELGVSVTGGMVNCIHYHILAVAPVVAEESDVVLDGLGGDALTGAHLSANLVPPTSPRRAAEALYRRRATGCSRAQRSELFSADFEAAVGLDPAAMVSRHFAGLGNRNAWIGAQRFDLLERQRRFIQFGPHLLRPYVDVVTPFYGAPTRHLCGWPLSSLFAQRAYLQMHARRLSRQAAVPDAAQGLSLTHPPLLRLAHRLARGAARRSGLLGEETPVIDYADWFRHGPIGELLHDRLVASEPARRGLFRSEVVRRFVEEHLRGVRDHSTVLACLLTFDESSRQARATAPSRRSGEADGRLDLGGH